MTDAKTRLADEIFEHSHEKALEIIAHLYQDGNRPFAIQTIFMTGAAMSAAMSNMDRKTYIDGIVSVYDNYQNLGKHIDQIIKGDKLS